MAAGQARLGLEAAAAQARIAVELAASGGAAAAAASGWLAVPGAALLCSACSARLGAPPAAAAAPPPPPGSAAALPFFVSGKLLGGDVGGDKGASAAARASQSPSPAPAPPPSPSKHRPGEGGTDGGALPRGLPPPPETRASARIGGGGADSHVKGSARARPLLQGFLRGHLGRSGVGGDLRRWQEPELKGRAAPRLRSHSRLGEDAGWASRGRSPRWFFFYSYYSRRKKESVRPQNKPFRAQPFKRDR